MVACVVVAHEHEPKWHPQELPADIRFNNSVIHTHTNPHTLITKW